MRLLTTLFLISTLANATEVDLNFRTGDEQGVVAIFRDVPLRVYENYVAHKQSGDLGPIAPLTFGKPFKDYPAEESRWMMDSGIFPLPSGLEGYGFLLQGNNHSDDMDMYLVKKFEVKPNTVYQIRTKVDKAVNDPGGVAGPGGSPGLKLNSVVVDFDPTEFVANPKNPEENVKHARIGFVDVGFTNFDSSGTTIACMKKSSFSPSGDICPATGPIPYKIVEGRYGKVMEKKSNAKGELWLMVGSHSGHEAFNAIFYTRIVVDLTVKP